MALLCFFVLCINVKAKNDWVEVRTNNFLLVGNANERDIRSVALKLERFRQAFSQVYVNFEFESRVPTTVVVFNDERSFRRFKPVENGKTKDWVAGFFQASEAINYIVLSIDRESTDKFQVIFHEYTHFLIKNTLKREKIPNWLNEGLAEYYENLEIEGDRKVRLGAVKLGHMKTLKENSLIPPSRFFDDRSEHIEKSSDDKINLFYAQSWALVHYFIHGNSGKRRSQLQKFQDLLRDGMDTRQAFQSAFEDDYQTITNELKSYIVQNSFNSKITNLASKLEVTGEMKVTRISHAKAKSYQGDLLYRSNRLDEAEKVLKEALSLNDNEEMGNISLGLVKMNQGDYRQAAKFLEKAIGGGSLNFLAYYYHAFVLSRSTVNERGIINSYDPTIVQEMRRSLEKAISLNPKFPDSYILFALISIVQNEDLDNGLKMAEIAIELSPDSEMFRLRRSELLLRKKEIEKSRESANEIFEKTTDKDVRDFAEKLLGRISNYEIQLEISNRINEGNKYIVKEDELLTPQELADLNRRIEIDSINKNLRKLQEGESRVIGRINRIDCDQKGVGFFVSTAEKDFKFVSKTFKELVFYTYQIQLKGGEIGCETDLSKFFSIVTFSSSTQPNEYDGELVSIEFVPDYFVFSE